MCAYHHGNIREWREMVKLSIIIGKPFNMKTLEHGLVLTKCNRYPCGIKWKVLNQVQQHNEIATTVDPNTCEMKLSSRWSAHNNGG